MPRLRDGSTTHDPRLDRLQEFDEQSRRFKAVDLVTREAEREGLKNRAYRVGKWLNQGVDGACVGFAFTHEICSTPARVKHWREIDFKFAHNIYCRAQVVDPWEGGSRSCGHPQPWYEGTSMLAGVKVMKELGFYTEYRWAFGEEDLAWSVSHIGPAVIGVNWYEGMFDPNVHGYIEPTGRIMGGHAIMVQRIHVETHSGNWDQSYALWNSWGRRWGINGWCLISRDHMARLLSEAGEALIPITRQR